MASNTINYEVMVLQGGRWEVHASYPQELQGQAIKDAKALENISTIKGVKVVREETDSDSGETKENNVYASSNLAEEQPKGAQEAKFTRQSAPVSAASENPAAKGKPKGKSERPGKSMKSGDNIPQHIVDYDPDAADHVTFSFFRLVVRLLMVVLFSAIIAATVSGLGGILLGGTELRASIQTNILNGLFFGSFFLSVVWMSFSFLSKAKIASSKRPRPAPKSPKLPPENPVPKTKQKDRVDFGDETNRMAEETRIAEDKNKTEQADQEDPGDQVETVTADVQAAPPPVSGAKPGSGGAEIGILKKEDAPWIKKQKDFVMDYLAESLEGSGANTAAMDNFNKFGVNLFIAGAVETLSQARNLDGNTTSQILGDAVKFMGFRNRDAEAFSDKIQSYLLADSRYMQMYQAGRSSMMAYLEGDAEGASTLAAALTEWNTRKLTKKASGPVTVLFTDIAGSTNMTQTMGDALAQQVVRAHNKIVRDALHKFNGKEIKHTGDGIMASFSTTSNGVEAAAEMQKGALKHTAANPDLPLALKIGINAGEPIAEDDDLFGTTVQMAARIVDKAYAGQVFVSDIVQGLCGGKNFNFVAHPGFEMKGFDGAITLHELIWNADVKPTSEKSASRAEIGSEIGADIKTGTPEPVDEADDGETVTTRPAPEVLAKTVAETSPETAPEAPVEPEKPTLTPGAE